MTIEEKEDDTIAFIQKKIGWADVKARLRDITNKPRSPEVVEASIRLSDLDVIRRYIGDIEWLAIDRWSVIEQADEESEELEKHLNTIKAKADELVEIIQHSAPTGWAASGDIAEASEWEKEATKVVEAYEECFPYEPKVSLWEILEESGVMDK